MGNRGGGYVSQARPIRAMPAATRPGTGDSCGDGLVYRSGTLSHLSSDGVAAYRRLGVKTVLDLRNRPSTLPLFNGDVLSVQLASRVQGCRATR